MVQCQNERSQHSNKDKAMKMLMSKLYLIKKQENEEKLSDIRDDIETDKEYAIKGEFIANGYEKNTLNWSLANIDNVTEDPLDCAMIFTDKEVAQYVCNDLYRHDGELDWFVEDVNSGFLFNVFL